MADDVIGKERLAVFVPVQSPRVRSAIGDDFENVARRMITPNAAIELKTSFVRRSGAANELGGGDSMPAIEPAIGPPRQPVHKIMPRLQRETVQMHDRWAVRAVVTVLIRKKQQVRRRCNPNPAKANGDAAEAASLIEENFPF